MKLPSHSSRPGTRSRAPYNFVPLPEAILIAPASPFAGHDRLASDRLHGEITLEIRAETPLYTRCAHPPELGDAEVVRTPEKQEFYHHGDPSRPVIPGSSLRGMVRSLVEILSYSRITRRPERGEATRVVDRRLVYRAVAEPDTADGKAYHQRFSPPERPKAGYLARDKRSAGRVIKPAQEPGGSSYVRVEIEHIRNAQIPPQPNTVRDVWVEPSEAISKKISTEPGPGLVQGKLVQSGPIGNRKKHTVVYAPEPRAAPIPIPHSVWERFQEDQEMQRGIDPRVVEVGDPVFYFAEEGMVTFLGPTLYFRVPHQRYTGDFIPAETSDAGELNGLDLAESIFGTVNEGEREHDDSVTGAHRGRVSFDDARWRDEGRSLFLEGAGGRRWTAVLSAPKPTSYQHYLVQQIKRDDRAPLKRQLAGYSSATPDDSNGAPRRAALRGFKRYWHRGEPSSNELTTGAPGAHPTQHTKVRPVRAGTTFEGRIRFENLTSFELGALLAAFELPRSCRHHLGMGKPLGMGTVRVDASVRLYDPRQRYQDLSSPGWLSRERIEEKLRVAREDFRGLIIEHHQRSGGAPELSEGAELWSIPRLAELRHMLEWDERPERAKTAYIEVLKEFRARKVLPAPSEVRGIEGNEPEETAESDPKENEPAEVLDRRGGRISRFSHSGVKVRIDGEPRSRPVPLTTDIFPLEQWGKLNGNVLCSGRTVTVELRGDRVERVVPTERREP